MTRTLEQAEPELAADLVDNGITMAGGVSLLRGLTTVISNATGLDVRLAEDPLTCVARGTSVYLENLELWKDTMESDADDVGYDRTSAALVGCNQSIDYLPPPRARRPSAGRHGCQRSSFITFSRRCSAQRPLRVRDSRELHRRVSPQLQSLFYPVAAPVRGVAGWVNERISPRQAQGRSRRPRDLAGERVRSARN